MLDLYDQIEEAAAAIRSVWSETPHAGVILGTGLGNFAASIEPGATLDYADIPHFLTPTATSHRGRLVCGRLAGVPILAMEGRFHAYEGYPLQRITLPVRVMKRLGAKLLILSQAVGGMNPNYRAGDVMIIDDHVNLMGDNPLIGINDDRLGPRFPDMSSPYDRSLGDQALAIARQHDFVCHRGTYIAMLGPTYETRAEIRMLRQWGDAVGMSTVPEVIVAAHAGLCVLGLSTITNVCSPDIPHTTSGDEIVATANTAKDKLLAIVNGTVAEIST